MNEAVTLAVFKRKTEKRRHNSGAPHPYRIHDAILLCDVCNVVAEIELAVEVFAGNSRTVGGNADGSE